ncbi:MAG: cysteine desulfurase family protein [Candidatus Saccharimonadales bacterium]
MSQNVYLDYAAATPLDPEVLEAMQPFLTDQFYNPSATYSAAINVRKQLEAGRSKVAHWLGANSSDIIFTAGGTEANNLAIHGVMQQFAGANIVVSSIEHDSVLVPANQYEVRHVAVDEKGRVNLEDLAKKIDENTALVSVMYANNEIGTIQPIREVAKIVHAINDERRTTNGLPLYLHTDACQAANYLDLHVSRLGVDLMTVNGGKIYGPKQSGCLYVKPGTKLTPLIYGGGQERKLRSGTENVANCVGFAHALDIAQQCRHEENERLQQLQQTFIKALQASVPSAQVNGSLKHRLPNNVHVTFPGVDNERVLIQLDEAGIMAAAGSACSASTEESSHVLRAIGVSETDAQASLRFTMGRHTDEAAIKTTVATLAQLVKT